MTQPLQNSITILAFIALAAIFAVHSDSRATYWLSGFVDRSGARLARFLVWCSRLVISLAQHTSRRLRIKADAKAYSDQAHKLAYGWHERLTIDDSYLVCRIEGGNVYWP